MVSMKAWNIAMSTVPWIGGHVAPAADERDRFE